MTAPLLSSFVQSAHGSSRFSCQQFDPKTEELTSRRSNSKHLAPDRTLEQLSAANMPEEIALGAVCRQLLELLPQGVIIATRSLKPVYWNGKAKTLCRQMLDADFSVASLPLPIAEACHRFLRQSQSQNQLVLEYRTAGNYLLRIRTHWLEIETRSDDVIPLPIPGVYAGQVGNQTQRDLIAIFLENCEEFAQEEGRIQQQKYDLTEREAEIWMLLRKEYTYQEIAQMLQISLNTVKTHVKNVYAKRRSCQGKEKFWYFERKNGNV